MTLLIFNVQKRRAKDNVKTILLQKYMFSMTFVLQVIFMFLYLINVLYIYFRAINLL